MEKLVELTSKGIDDSGCDRRSCRATGQKRNSIIFGESIQGGKIGHVPTVIGKIQIVCTCLSTDLGDIIRRFLKRADIFRENKKDKQA